MIESIEVGDIFYYKEEENQQWRVTSFKPDGSFTYDYIQDSWGNPVDPRNHDPFRDLSIKRLNELGLRVLKDRYQCVVCSNKCSEDDYLCSECRERPEPINYHWPHGLEEADVETRKNVIDYYQHWEHEDIREDMLKKSHPFVVVAENYAYDFNVATTIRNANAFLARKTFITGRRQWDKRGACGAYKYINIQSEPESLPVLQTYKGNGYDIIAIDNIEGAKSIYDHKWDPCSVMIFGQESIGVSQAALDIADHILYLPMLGSIRSLNVGTASGITMFHYCSQQTTK